MIHDRNYIYLQKKASKVKLLAQYGEWQWKIDDVSITMTDSVERQLVYSAYNDDNSANFYELLRSCSRKLDGFSMERLRMEFVKKHPLMEDGVYDINCIPVYATDSIDFELILDSNTRFKISKDIESELLVLVKNRMICCKEECIKILKSLCNEYGLDFSKKIKDRDPYELMFMSFLNQHGVSYKYIKDVCVKRVMRESARIKKQQQRNAINTDDSFVLPSERFSRVLSIVLSTIVTALWIVVFNGFCDLFWLIPLLVFLVMMAAKYNDRSLFDKKGFWFGYYIGFFLTNIVISAVSFAMAYDYLWSLITLFLSLACFVLSIIIKSVEKEK